MKTHKLTAKEDRLLRLMMGCAVDWQDSLVDANRNDKRQLKVELRYAYQFRDLLRKMYNARSPQDQMRHDYKDVPTMDIMKIPQGTRKFKAVLPSKGEKKNG